MSADLGEALRVMRWGAATQRPVLLKWAETRAVLEIVGRHGDEPPQPSSPYCTCAERGCSDFGRQS